VIGLFGDPIRLSEKDKAVVARCARIDSWEARRVVGVMIILSFVLYKGTTMQMNDARDEEGS
jgi:hypothetical protein